MFLSKLAKYKHVFLLALFAFLIIIYNVRYKKDKNSVNLSDLITSEELTNTIKLFNDGNKLLLFIDFDSFECHLCMEDFLDFCDTLSNFYETHKVNPPILMIVKKESRYRLDEEDRLSLWKKYNHAEFKHIIVPDSIFKLYNITDVLGVVINNNNKIIYQKSFPMGRKSHIKILELLRMKE